jgi:glucose-1-phosphate thymidylyltransferase
VLWHEQPEVGAVQERKGIILAGGTGSRLWPATLAVSKQLLPVYDKPLIYYPLSVLMLAGIRHVVVISSPRDRNQFECLLGNGRALGLHIEHAEQPAPGGIAQALLIGSKVLGQCPLALVLGDNIFYGQGFQRLLRAASGRRRGATVFAYRVKEPSSYGVVELSESGTPESIVEKPSAPRSSLAVTGLYFYDEQAPAFASGLEPSARGELEITDVNRVYLDRGQLQVEVLSRGFAWLDAGTHDALIQAANFVQSVEQRQGLRIACLEEIAFRRGLISAEQLVELASRYPNSYGGYLRNLLNESASRSPTADSHEKNHRDRRQWAVGQ